MYDEDAARKHYDDDDADDDEDPDPNSIVNFNRARALHADIEYQRNLERKNLKLTVNLVRYGPSYRPASSSAAAARPYLSGPLDESMMLPTPDGHGDVDGTGSKAVALPGQGDQASAVDQDMSHHR